jgi:tRNA U34 5-carboxymethylaminomethyl modifying GTPase MnmE/TrmE
MDLVEAEGMADLINAETEMQRKQALSQMEGHLSSVYKQWRQGVIKCLANLEAYIDFSEDQNVDDNALADGLNLKISCSMPCIQMNIKDLKKNDLPGINKVILNKVEAVQNFLSE